MHQVEAKRVIDLVEIVRKLLKANESIKENGIESQILAMTIRLGEQKIYISAIGNNVYEVTRSNGQTRRTRVLYLGANDYKVGYDLGEETSVEEEATVPVRVIRDKVYKIHDFYFNSEGEQFEKLDDIIDN